MKQLREYLNEELLTKGYFIITSPRKFKLNDIVKDVKFLEDQPVVVKGEATEDDWIKQMNRIGETDWKYWSELRRLYHYFYKVVAE